MGGLGEVFSGISGTGEGGSGEVFSGTGLEDRTTTPRATPILSKFSFTYDPKGVGG